MPDTEHSMLSLIADSAAAFLADHTAQQTDSENLWKAMAEQGWTGMLLPEGAGGVELGLECAGEVLATICNAGCAGMLLNGALVPSAVMPATNALAGRISVGEISLSLAWQSELGQTAPYPTGCKYDANRITGQKVFVQNTDAAQKFLVSADGPDGIVLVLVSAQSTGLSVRGYPLSDESQAADLSFQNVNVEEVLCRGQEAEQALQFGMHAGMVLGAARLSGLAAITLEKTIAYLQGRDQFGQPLSHFQVLQHRVVDLYGQTRLANAGWRNAARRLDKAPHDTATHIAIHAAKARCSDLANQVAKSAIQLHGAFGFSEEAGLGVVLGTALAGSASFGNTALHRKRMFTLQEANQ